ncbi:MAG TPA: hypothetical protein VGM91_05375 [Conexibacter sp.]
MGHDVANELVPDLLKAQLKRERARARIARETAAIDRGDAPGASSAVETEEDARARRRVEREAEREARARAQAFNLDLGIAVLKAFAKVRVDARVLQILTAIDFKDDLDAIAARGARYGFPGWPVADTTGNGKTKTTTSSATWSAPRPTSSWRARTTPPRSPAAASPSP